MARKSSKAEGLRDRLGDLLGQRGQVEDRIAGLDAKRELATLEDQIAEVQATMAAEQKAALAAAVEKLRPQEREQIDRIVGQVAELKAAIQELDATQQAIRAAHGYPKASIPLDLYRAILDAERGWRVVGTWHGEGTMHDRTPAPQQTVTLPRERQGEIVTFNLPRVDDPDKSWLGR